MQTQVIPSFKVHLRQKNARQFWSSERIWTNDPNQALTFDSVPHAVSYALSNGIKGTRVALLDALHREMLVLPELE